MAGAMDGPVPQQQVYALRLWPKDLGVALVTIAALLLALQLRQGVVGATRTFQADGSSLTMTYPALWHRVEAPAGTVLQIEDPRAASTFKTTVKVENRELDPATPPTLQALADRRIEQGGELLAYRLLSTGEATVANARGMRLDYAYVVQPLDAPQLDSPPVVVRARQYIVVTANQVYYITLAAPENEFGAASEQFAGMLEEVRIR
jgi:hypothetical protein